MNLLSRVKLLRRFANPETRLVEIEACGSSEHWARQLLGLGHGALTWVALCALSAMAVANERGVTHVVPFFPAAAETLVRGEVRVVNESDESGTVDVVAIDAAGVRFDGASLAVGANETAHFDSEDLEAGNPDAGLSGGTGRGQGDWRLELTSVLDLEVQAYARTSDGALAEMYATAARDGDRFRIATFNPGSNRNQVGLLWLFNRSDGRVSVAVEGTDDLGRSPGPGVSIDLPAREARTLAAAELESGAAPGLTGSLGDGAGKWRLDMDASGPILAMSLLSSPTGHLTNVSTVPSHESDGVHRVPLFPSASDAAGRQGFARVSNRSDRAGEVRIEGFDDTGWTYEALTLAVGANETAHFNSNDLELGNADKGLAGSTGAGRGDWRLELTSGLEIEVLSYVRAVGGLGFVTPMHDTAAREADGLMRYYVPIFHPASYGGQESRLHLVNLGGGDARIGIGGVDDRGAPPAGDVSLVLGAGATRVLTAEQLENGGDGLDGRFGTGSGRWRLFVAADAKLQVTSLGYSSDGFLANLSRGSAPASESEAGRPDLVVETPSARDREAVAGRAFVLSATVRNRGDGDSEATTLRYYRSTNATISAADTQEGTDGVDALSASGSGGESATLTAPSEPGTYYYGACVDAVPGESDTANNCSAAVAARVSAAVVRPDLVVVSPSVSDSQPEAGMAFTLTATVRNAGDSTSASTTLRYYRSTNATISVSDAQVGTDAVVPLAASGSSAESATLNAPSEPGAYYYGACVDAVTDESDTTNNCSSAVGVTVPEPPRHPDLVVVSPSVSDSQPEAGMAFTLTATVRNQGDGDAAATTLRFYRSTDAAISTSDTQAGTDAVGALPASGGSAGSVTLNAPSEHGTYYYGACVDVVAGESDTTNNCSAAAAVTVTVVGDPDLAVPEFDAVWIDSKECDRQTGVRMEAVVRNIGRREAAPTRLRYYWSADATVLPGGTLSPDDMPLGGDGVRRLGASEAQEHDHRETSVLAEGYYGACVDAVAEESDTENNCSPAVRVDVPEGTGPDLVPDLFRASRFGDPGGITVAVSPLNQGAGDADASKLRFYRSGDATISSDDTQIHLTDSLAVEAYCHYHHGVRLTLPNQPGTYYYGACIAPVPGETDTTNNCSSSVGFHVP